MFNVIARQSKLIITMMLFIVLSGAVTFYKIPKENTPDVKVPLIYTSIMMRGASVEDVERLILRPVEKKLKGVTGIKKVSSNAVNSYASISAEFIAGMDVDQARQKIKDKIDEVRSELPQGIEEPVIKEIDFSKFPVLNLAIYGDLPEEKLIQIGRKLKKIIESVPNVLEVNMVGDRKDLVEIFIKPSTFEKYKIGVRELSIIADGNNQLISGGFLETGKFTQTIDTKSLLKNIQDIANSPALSRGSESVKFSDIGIIKQSFFEPTNIAFVNGKSAIVLEISKRYGTNVIQTIDGVKKAVLKALDNIPKDVNIEYSRDKSDEIKDSLSDLGNNVLFATILVIAIVISQLGKKQGIIVGMSIPISFFMGILVISLLGYTLNIVVLFALILASGMIVDASVIVTEYADRAIARGESHLTAYYSAAGRMAVPVLSATIGIIIVYLPLLFWPGVIGQFMRFIPITIIAVLSASILAALIFIPTLGYVFGKQSPQDEERHKKEEDFIYNSEQGNVLEIHGLMGKYINLLNKVIQKPKLFIWCCIAAFIVSIFLFKYFGKGVEFFPKIDARNIQIVLHGDSNLSVKGKTEEMKRLENHIKDISGDLHIMYTKIFGNSGAGRSNYADDVIGVIDLELKEWQIRDNSDLIEQKIYDLIADYHGGYVEVLQERPGPRAGDKKIQIEISSVSQEKILEPFLKILAHMIKDTDLKDLDTTMPTLRSKFSVEFDKSIAAKYGVDVVSFGNIIKMCTNGTKITAFRPDYAEESVDVVLKFPEKYCSADGMPNLSVYGNGRSIKIGAFSEFRLIRDIPIIQKIDGNVALKILSNVKQNVNANQKIIELNQWIKQQNIPSDIIIKFSGEDEDKKETGSFLMSAFGMAIFLKIAILIGQFNSIYYSLIVMSSVILSIIGVLVGLVITGKSFGIVMCGLGIISLAGIVVSNNIILIDTYQKMVQGGVQVREAILRTCVQRIRPIMMTSSTTIMGLIPMIFNISIDFMDLKIVYNAPSGQWWEQLSTTIGGGLLFATIFTLFLTPCCLMLHTPEAHSKTSNKPRRFDIKKLKNISSQ